MKNIIKIDIEKLGEYSKKLLSDEVILTEERIQHIKEHHPGDYEKYSKYISDVLCFPDYILEDNKNRETVLYMKTLEVCNKKLQIVVRLNTSEIGKKNSILTLWKVKEKTYNQLLRNRKIIWKKLDNNE